MCLCPIKIKNVNRRTGWFHNRVVKDGFHAARLFDTTSDYIYVPCGHCPECVRAKQNDIIQRSNLESIDSHLYFCTLTYNNEHLPVMDNPFRPGESFTYADITHIQLLMKRLRNQGLKFRYLACSERGTKRGRPHFHVLFFFPKKYYSDPYSLEKRLFTLVHSYWAENVGTRKNPRYVPLCTYNVSRNGRRNYDLHYCVPSVTNGYDDVSFYVSKYIFKYSDSDEKLKQLLWNSYQDFCDTHDFDPSDLPATYLDVWKTIKCRRLASISFGLGYHEEDEVPYNGVKTTLKIYNICRKFIERSKETFNSEAPMFKFYHDDGKSFPMSGYLRKKMLTTADLWDQYFASNSDQFDNFITNSKFSSMSMAEIQNKYHKFALSLERLDKRESHLDYEFDYEHPFECYEDIEI